MSHGDHKSHKAVVDLVKEYNKLNRHNVAIMLDTKGPEVRSGDVTEPIDMKAGDCLLTTPSTCSTCSYESVLHSPNLSYSLSQGICCLKLNVVASITAALSVTFIQLMIITQNARRNVC